MEGCWECYITGGNSLWADAIISMNRKCDIAKLLGKCPMVDLITQPRCEITTPISSCCFVCIRECMMVEGHTTDNGVVTHQQLNATVPRPN